MRKMVLMLVAAGAGSLAQPSFAQGAGAASQESSAVSSYSAPTEKHVKKPKTAKKHAGKKAAEAAPSASQ
ncbi:MAG TPA: acid-shock protein [Paraburkholderia sp.]|jgi:hypothetical protein|nr:acid-shock protein [Paraburkholderia sp.]